MALIYCPECHARISDRATVCPCCGFREEASGALVPISALPSSIKPVCVQVLGMAVFDDGTNLISSDAKRRFSDFMKDAEQMAKFAPTIYDAISNLLSGDKTVWAADFSEAAEKLMEKGDLVLSVDKSTKQFLPTLRDAKTGRIYEQARLHEEFLPDNLDSSFDNILMQASMAEILSEIREVTREVEHLRMEMRADRIGAAKSVWFQLQDATHIQDTRLREQRILSIAGSATEQRYVLQENFSLQLGHVFAKGEKTKTRGEAAHEALTDLSVISVMAGTEYAAYSLLDESEAAMSALAQFNGFIRQNRLDERDTLLELNSVSDENLTHVIDSFQGVASNVVGLVSSTATRNEAGYLPREGSSEV